MAKTFKTQDKAIIKVFWSCPELVIFLFLAKYFATDCRHETVHSATDINKFFVDISINGWMDLSEVWLKVARFHYHFPGLYCCMLVFLPLLWLILPLSSTSLFHSRLFASAAGIRLLPSTFIFQLSTTNCFHLFFYLPVFWPLGRPGLPRCPWTPWTTWINSFLQVYASLVR